MESHAGRMLVQGAMGLDSVELIFAVEDAFQIHLDDAEVSCVATVGDLHALVQSKLRQSGVKRCLTSVAFYRIRRAMVDVLGVDRRAIKPATRLDDLFPKAERVERWNQVRRRLGLKMPSLRHPAWLEMSFLAGGIALLAVAAIYAGLAAGWILLLVLPGMLFGVILLRLTPQWATRLPISLTTAGDLARDVLAFNSGRLKNETDGWSEAECWETLCRVIVHQTCIEREKIRPESRIVDDLGID